MEYRRLLTALALLLTITPSLSGCQAQNQPRELTLSDFDRVKSDMDLQEVFNEVGVPDRFWGSGIVEYQYDLVDGREVILFFSGRRLYAKVQERDGTWTRLELAERPKEPAAWRIGKWVLLAVVVLGVGYGVWRWRRQRQRRPA